MVKELVKYVDTDFVLCTQWDAYILNPEAWDEAFLEYDYIGAPWWFQDGNNVGNGGFSLRSKRFLQVCSELPLRNFHPEDLILCRTYSNLLESKGIKFAPEHLAAKFSREGNQKYGYCWQGELGFHDYEMTDISAWTPPETPATFHKIYRICDKRLETNSSTITKMHCLQNFINTLGLENTTFIADNCTPETIKQLQALGQAVVITTLGNAGSLKLAFEMAMELPEEDIVYLIEDDFLHTAGAEELIKEGLTKADYVSLYDHADKYAPGPNPYVGKLGEKTQVFLTNHSHWKLTNSTVQTFATKVKTLKEDKDIIWKYNFEQEVPDSFHTFIDLGKKGRLLATTIPGRSTHCHSPWESPLINWGKVIKETVYDKSK